MEELSFKHYLDTMEEGWLYFLMGWISVAPMVLPGHCLLPTVWLGDGNRVPCIQDEDHMARCEVCGFVFCGKCRAVTPAWFYAQEWPEWWHERMAKTHHAGTQVLCIKVIIKWPTWPSGRHFVPSVPGVSSRQGADPAGMWPSQVSQLRCWVCLCWWSDGSTGIQSSWDWPWGRRSEEIRGDLRRSEGKIMASLSTFCRLLLHARSCWLCGI